MELVPNPNYKPPNIKPSHAKDPVIAKLVELADKSTYGYKNIAKAAGCNSDMLTNMRRGRVPSLRLVAKVASVLGFEINLVPKQAVDGKTVAWGRLSPRGTVDLTTIDAEKAEIWRFNGYEVVELVVKNSS